MVGRLRKLRETVKDWSLRKRTKEKYPRASLFLRRKLLKSLEPTPENIRARFLKLFPNISYGIISRISKILISGPRILGVGKKRATFGLGSFINPETGEEIHLACKLELVDNTKLSYNIEEKKRSGKIKYNWLPSNPKEINDDYYFYRVRDADRFRADNAKLERIRNMGIPAAKTFGVVDRSLDSERLKYGPDYIQIVEDLSQGDRFFVKEFFGMNSRVVNNSSELHELFEEYFAKISSKFRIHDSASHGGATSLREEIERCFFVVIDPETRIGKLVCGDVDQIQVR